jgi:hypothetical protein
MVSPVLKELNVHSIRQKKCAILMQMENNAFMHQESLKKNPAE